MLAPMRRLWRKADCSREMVLPRDSGKVLLIATDSQPLREFWWVAGSIRVDRTSRPALAPCLAQLLPVAL